MARIGLRNLKTALAVFICMIISKVLKLEYPFFVVIAAIISMENSVTNSFKAGKNRMLGTLIGAVIGLICALIRPGSALLCGIGMVGVIYCCNFLKWRKPIPIAGIVFIAVMVSIKGKNPFFYSINRMFDTLIGIVVAVAVNYLVFPPNYLPRIRRMIRELSVETKYILDQLFIKDEELNLVDYEQKIIKVIELWELSREDSKIYRRKLDREISGTQNVLDDLAEIYRHLRIVIQLKPVSIPNPANAGQLQLIFNQSELLPHQENKEVNNIVFNYHLQEALNLYHDITDFTAD